MGRPIGFLLLGAGFLFANRNCRRRKARSHTLVSYMAASCWWPSTSYLGSGSATGTRNWPRTAAYCLIWESIHRAKGVSIFGFSQIRTSFAVFVGGWPEMRSYPNQSRQSRSVLEAPSKLWPLRLFSFWPDMFYYFSNGPTITCQISDVSYAINKWRARHKHLKNCSHRRRTLQNFHLPGRAQALFADTKGRKTLKIHMGLPKGEVCLCNSSWEVGKFFWMVELRLQTAGEKGLSTTQ